MRFKFQNTLACDAIYVDGQSQKLVLAGVYSGDLNFTEMPARVRLSFFMDMVPDADGNSRLDAQFFLDSKQIGGAIMELRGLQAGKSATVMIPHAEVEVHKPSRFRLKVAVDGARAVTVLDKQMLLAAPAH